MAKTDALARVSADLARGRTHPAIQRLSSLVAVHPTDLDLRRRLAAVHRMVGNLVEAGRWAYLDPAANPVETRAFERAYPSPARRLVALRWPAGAELAPTEYARHRLAHLIRVSTDMRRHRMRYRLRPRQWVMLLTAAAVAVVLAGLGAVTVVQWLT